MMARTAGLRNRTAMAAVVGASALVLTACGTGGTNAGNASNATQTGSNAAAQTSTPQSSTGNSVADNPQQYVGKQVTIAGTVGHVWSPTVFSVVTQNGGGAGGSNNGGITGSGNTGAVGGSGSVGSTNNNGGATNNNGATNNGGTNSGTAGGASGQSGQRGLLIVSKTPLQLTAGSPVQVTGMLQGSFSTQAAQSFAGSLPGGNALTSYDGQPFVEAQFGTSTISSNLTSGNNGGFFGSGVFGGGNGITNGGTNNGGTNTGGTTGANSSGGGNG